MYLLWHCWLIAVEVNRWNSLPPQITIGRTPATYCTRFSTWRRSPSRDSPYTRWIATRLRLKYSVSSSLLISFVQIFCMWTYVESFVRVAGSSCRHPPVKKNPKKINTPSLRLCVSSLWRRRTTTQWMKKYGILVEWFRGWLRRYQVTSCHVTRTHPISKYIKK